MLDVSRYGLGYKERTAALRRFELEARICNPLPSLVFKRLTGRYLWETTAKRIYIEQDHRFDPEILRLPDGSTLNGYFQSEKYFRDIAEILKDELNFEFYWKTSDETAKMLSRIRSSNSVAVHVRRRDEYIRNPRFHVCNQRYYALAMDFFRDHFAHPTFFVFSDNPEWASQVISGKDCVFCALKQSTWDHLNDMRLMSHCRHNIISNSSFAWWGAYLNKNKRKKVVCPYKWVNDDDVPIEDKLCRDWVKIIF